MNTKKKIIVGTHSGIFHQDDVVAVALISILHGRNVEVIRTRDPLLLATCDYVVDVGGGEFDHHMPGGNGFRKDGIPYASAGLVWKKYGNDILEICGCPDDLFYDANKRVDEKIIEPVDKIDNGYMDTSIFDFVPLYIPNWDEDFNKDMSGQFRKVTNLARKILITAIKREIANVKSEEVMYNCINMLHLNSRILEIPNQYIEWKRIVTETNTVTSLSIDFVVFPYPLGGYAAQSVPPSLDEPFKQRIPFPREWAGLTTTLPEVSGVRTATFCHDNLFFIRAETKEDVYELCEIAIEQF